MFYRTRSGIGPAVVALVVCLVIMVTVFGIYFETSSSTAAATSSEVSSLKAATSQDGAIIVSQQSTISCLQSQVSSLESTRSISVGTTNSTVESSSCVRTSGPQRQVNITGSLTVPTGTGIGNLVVSVWNGASIPITGIYVNVTSGYLSPQSGNPVFKYNGAAISITNPLPEGVTVSGNATVTSGGTGLFVSYGYDFQVTITFEDGVIQTQSLYLRAQV